MRKIIEILNNCSISCLEYDGHTDILVTCEDKICQEIELHQDAVLDYIKNTVKNVNSVVFQSTNSSYKVTFELCSLEDKLDKQAVILMAIVLILQCMQVFTSGVKTLCIETYKAIKIILKSAKEAIKSM